MVMETGWYNCGRKYFFESEGSITSQAREVSCSYTGQCGGRIISTIQAVSDPYRVQDE